MKKIKFYKENPVPIEFHKVKIVQKLNLLPVETRVKKIKEAFNNVCFLKNQDVFLDMYTDSGVNAMTDKQLGAMMEADDAYCGSQSFYKLESAAKEFFGMPYFLPAHQGRACEHLLARVFVKPGEIVPMNYHFTTTKALITQAGGKVLEIVSDKGLEEVSSLPFKGDIDLNKLNEIISKKSKIAFVRIEAGTNLIGGQPVSVENMEEVFKICRRHKIKTILDASLLADNVYFNKIREVSCKKLSIKSIIDRICKCFDIIYFSARKLTCSRGGGMCFRNEEDYIKVRDILPLYEGFSTYGGISVREMEAMAVGLLDTYDEDFISQGPTFIQAMTDMLLKNNVPVVTPAGGLGLHLDCKRFLPHLSQSQYPAATLDAALYIVAGMRGDERGTLSEDRDEKGREIMANMELLRLALPRRVFTLSQITFAVDRITWLYENRELVGGLKFIEEPKVLRFFFGKMEEIGNWQDKLVQKFKADLGEL